MLGANAFIGFEERANTFRSYDWSDKDDWSDSKDDWGENNSGESWGENATGSENDGDSWTDLGIWGNQD